MRVSYRRRDEKANNFFLCWNRPRLYGGASRHGVCGRLGARSVDRQGGMNRLSQMSYFVAIAEEGQMTRAARRLHLAQPALSHAMAQLESRLGVKVFERSAHGVELTPAGELFLPKARTALAAVADAERAAQSLSVAACGSLEFGFLGVAPVIDSPRSLERLSRLHPEIEVRYRELPFPSAPTSSWLAHVDVAACHMPPRDPHVWSLPIRSESRMVLASARHPLSERSEVRVADVLDETFVGFHPSVDSTWAGFWSLDDHRGARPARVTGDAAGNPQEVLASLAARCAITTVPATVGRVLSRAWNGVVAIRLRDALPATITLVGHEDQRNPHAAAMRVVASELR
jgi:DNA-binding transcriptional LysR family regulator